jgi:Tol biopolymer transport system component
LVLRLAVVGAILVGAALASAAGAIPSAKDGPIVYDNSGETSLDIWVIKADGSGVRDLTAAEESDDTDPAFSPDSRKIAFVSDRGNEDGNTFVWVMNADGSNAHKLGGGGIFQAAPAWSPDGKRIAFMRCAREVEGGGDCSTGQIAVIGVNGKGLKLVTKPLRAAAADSHPSWSPNGKTIVFERRVSFGNVTVWTVSSDGKGLKRILDDDSQAAHVPSFSPNGKQIVYVTDTDGPEAIGVMNANGKSRRKIIEEGTDPDDPGAQGGGVENPAFAPTGNRIVFMAGGDLWIVGLDGKNPVQITDDGGDDPDWGRG